MNPFLGCSALGVAGACANVVAADRQEHDRRPTDRCVSMFGMNDVDTDNVASRHEARTTIERAARYDDITINQDSNINWAELTRYLDANVR